MQPGEGEFRLGRHARRADHRHITVASSHRGSLEQRGLPDPGLAAHDERPAAPPDPIDQVVKPSELVLSAEKLGDSRVGARARQVDLRLLRRQRYNVRSEVQSNDLSDARHLALSSRSG